MIGTLRIGCVALVLAASATGQTPRPERIVLTWAGDPATTQAVTWRTLGSVERPVVHVRTAPDDPAVLRTGRGVRSIAAVSTPVTTDAGQRVVYHTAQIIDLEPDRLYAYRVGAANAWSEWNHFRTAADGPRPFSFVYVGDAQNELDSLWPRTIRAAFGRAPNCRFILYAGDLVDAPASDRQWGQWLDASGWIHRRVPCLATPGNHEYYRLDRPNPTGRIVPAGPDGIPERRLTPMWRPQFAFPTNGVPALAETNYRLDVQGLRIISLNSNERIAEQARWLERALADDPQPWTVVTCHHPIYSTKASRDNPTMRDAWRPLFTKHGVDLVVQGHDHAYGRRADPPSAEGDRIGPVYVVSVSGPKMYSINPDLRGSMQCVARDTQLYQVITVDGDRLRYRAFTVTGRLLDAFDLRKNPRRIERCGW